MGMPKRRSRPFVPDPTLATPERAAKFLCELETAPAPTQIAPIPTRFVGEALKPETVILRALRGYSQLRWSLGYGVVNPDGCCEVRDISSISDLCECTNFSDGLSGLLLGPRTRTAEEPSMAMILRAYEGQLPLALEEGITHHAGKLLMPVPQDSRFEILVDTNLDFNPGTIFSREIVLRIGSEVYGGAKHIGFEVVSFGDRYWAPVSRLSRPGCRLMLSDVTRATALADLLLTAHGVKKERLQVSITQRARDAILIPTTPIKECVFRLRFDMQRFFFVGTLHFQYGNKMETYSGLSAFGLQAELEERFAWKVVDAGFRKATSGSEAVFVSAADGLIRSRINALEAMDIKVEMLQQNIDPSRVSWTIERGFSATELFRARVDLAYDEKVPPQHIHRLLHLFRGKQRNVMSHFVAIPPDWEGDAIQVSNGHIGFNSIGALATLVSGNVGSEDAGLRRVVDRLRGIHLDHIQVPACIKARLRPYQLEGFRWMAGMLSAGLPALLADDMGLGKSIQTIALLAWLMEEKLIQLGALVVCPANALDNWREELTAFWPSVKIFASQSASDSFPLELPSGSIGLITYGTLVAKMRSKHVRAGVVIFDEVQDARNPDSIRARTCRRLSAPLRAALSGTPVNNSARDLYSLAHVLHLDHLGNREQFQRTFAGPIKRGDVTAATRLKELISPFILRRTKAQVLTDLPPKTIVTVPCQMTDQQARLYETLRKTAFDTVQRAINEKGINQAQLTILTALLRLRQAANLPALMGKKLPSGKMALIVDRILELKREGRPALVFSTFVGVIKHLELMLTKRGIKTAVITGAVKNRGSLVKDFQNEQSDIDVFLLSTKAGGVAINLTRADTVFIVDPWFNPFSELQAIDRSHRFGQKRPVFVYRFISHGTFEEHIHDLQAEKVVLHESFFQDGSAAALLTPEIVAKLFADPEARAA